MSRVNNIELINAAVECVNQGDPLIYPANYAKPVSYYSGREDGDQKVDEYGIDGKLERLVQLLNTRALSAKLLPVFLDIKAKLVERGKYKCRCEGQNSVEVVGVPASFFDRPLDTVSANSVNADNAGGVPPKLSKRQAKRQARAARKASGSASGSNTLSSSSASFCSVGAGAILGRTHGSGSRGESKREFKSGKSGKSDKSESKKPQKSSKVKASGNTERQWTKKDDEFRASLTPQVHLYGRKVLDHYKAWKRLCEQALLKIESSHTRSRSDRAGNKRESDTITSGAGSGASTFDVPDFVDYFSQKTSQRQRLALRKQIIAYLTVEEAAKYKITFVQGKIVFVDPNPAFTLTSRRYIFAWDQDHSLYLGMKSKGSFQHTSFTSGRPVLCAGFFTVVNGVITEIKGHSGHYKPSEFHLRQFLHFLSHPARLGPNVYSIPAILYNGDLLTHQHQSYPKLTSTSPTLSTSSAMSTVPIGGHTIYHRSIAPNRPRSPKSSRPKSSRSGKKKREKKEREREHKEKDGDKDKNKASSHSTRRSEKAHNKDGDEEKKKKRETTKRTGEDSSDDDESDDGDKSRRCSKEECSRCDSRNARSETGTVARKHRHH